MRSERGFLLLEVMASIIVLTGGMLFVIRAFSTAKDALYTSRDLLKYSTLLEEKMFDFEETGVIEEGKDSGHFPDRKELLWSDEAAGMDFQSRILIDLCSVKLDVFSEGHSNRPKYSLYTYLEKKRARE